MSVATEQLIEEKMLISNFGPFSCQVGKFSELPTGGAFVPHLSKMQCWKHWAHIRMPLGALGSIFIPYPITLIFQMSIVSL